MKKSRRTAQVGEMIRDALVQVFRQDIREIDLALFSITDVEVSPDLHLARVFISGLKEDETKAIVKELQARAGRIRSGLGKRIRLRYTPELEFKFDVTTMRASRIEDLLREVMPKEASPADSGEDKNDDHHDDEPS